MRFCINEILASFVKNVDFFVVRSQVIENDFKLAVFDLDGTLITNECIDEIAKEAGVGLLYT